jgi:peptide/nickel transport system substrate-binding protein
MSKKLRILIIVALSLLVLNSALAVRAQSNIFVMARAADTTGLDPHKQTAFASLRLLELIYEPLVTLDENLNTVPALAESWEFNDDATKLTLQLRQGVKFHDGSTFDSGDVKATFARILDEATGAAGRANYTGIDTIDTPDANTVIFNLKTADVPILAALSGVNASMVSEEAIAANNFEATAIGTGPFILEKWTSNEKTTLKSNPDWWGGAPAIDGIEMRVIPDETSIVAALRAGEIDFGLLNDPLVATQLTDDANIQLNRVPAIAYHVFQLNPARKPMDSLEVRQAIACAIDRQEVLDVASLGEGQVTPPITIPAFRIPTDDLFCYTRDVEKAKELLAKAGMEAGFSIKVIASSVEPPTSIPEAQTIQAQLAEIGITVEIESLENSIYIDRWLKGDFDAAVALNGGRPDPYTMYARYWRSDGNLQVVTNYHDDTLDELLAKGRAETDQKTRFDIFSDFQKHLVEAAPWVWLYNGYEYTAQQKYVEGFVANPTDSLASFATVKLNK